MKYRLQDLIDIEQFQSLQNSLNAIYPFPSAIIDNDGVILTATAWQDVCTKFHRQNKECEKECIKSDQYILEHISEANPAVSYRCPHGLIDNAMPIILNGEHLGNFFTGQFFMEEPDLEFFRAQAAKYGFDEDAYLQAVKKVPIWRAEQLNSYLLFIKEMINVIGNVGLNRQKDIESGNALRKSEEKFRALFEQAGDYILVIELTKEGDLVIVDVNKAACKVHGYSYEEFNGMLLSDLDKSLDEEKISAFLKRLLSGETLKFETSHIKKDGTIFPVEVSANLITIGDNSPIIISTERDITERKQIDKKLREKDLQFGKLSANVPDMIYQFTRRLDGSYYVPIASEGIKNIFGCKPEDVVDDFTPIGKVIHPDDADRVIKDIEYSAKHLTYFTCEFRVILPDRGIQWIYSKSSPEKLPDGSITWYGFNANITERKQADIEKEKLIEQLTQAQKMEAIGTLAGGIAHDFNNILGVIMGYTDLTLDNLSDTKKVIKNLQHVMKASERAKEMVQQILAFSRKDEQTMISVNIGKIIKETASFLRSTIPTTIEIKINIDKNTGLIFGNITQINQVLMNLCTNAAFAMKEKGGVLEISLKEVVLDKESSILSGLLPGVYQQLTVSDTGTGMNKEILERIFEPYFTTKAVDEGTGMGLAVIYGIIKSHRGDIKVYSEPGKGTVFNVYFPVPDSDNTQKSASTDTVQPEVMGNNENILFVDDEVSLVELSTQMITNLGYQVDNRTSSIEALEAFKAGPDKYDLIITDMTMPNMTGVKLAEKIHKIKPDIPVILCTGFSNGISKSNYKAQGISALIMKPVVKRELAEAIRDVLDRKE